MGLSANASTLDEFQRADYYRSIYSSIIEYIGEPLHTAHLEHVSSQQKAAPYPILQSVSLLNSASVTTPYLGVIHYRAHRAEGTPTELEVHSIGISPNYPEHDQLEAIERILLARVLFDNPDVEILSLRLSQESVTALRQTLDEIDPDHRLTPVFASKLQNLGKKTPSASQASLPASDPRLIELAENLASRSTQKTHFNDSILVTLRLSEMLTQGHLLNGNDLARWALSKIDEVALTRDFGFSKISSLGGGPDIQTIEIKFGRTQ